MNNTSKRTTKMITGSGGITKEWTNIVIPHYEETWVLPACKVENGQIVLDPSRKGTVIQETKRWEVYCEGKYICTKRLIRGGAIASSEAVALPYPKPDWVR